MKLITKSIIIFLLCMAPTVQAVESQNVKETTNESVTKSDFVLLENRFIEERHILERQADRQYLQLKDTFHWTIGCFLFLATLSVTLFYFFFGRDRKEVKKMINETMNQEINRLISQSIEPFRERLTQLQDEVNQLMNFQNRKIVWVASLNEETNSTHAAFSAVGLPRIEVTTPTDQESLNLGDCDLVILSFDSSDRAKRLLRAIVDVLKDRSGTIHLIVYTYGDGTTSIRIEPEDMQCLAELKWFSMANFPSTMIAQVVSLVRGSIAPIRGSNGSIR